MDKCVLVTGGAGFIGGALIDRLLETEESRVVCLDKLTYAGNRVRLSRQIEKGLEFHPIDIADGDALDEAIASIRPNLVFHLAAESHVDRSIDGPAPFIATNILGTSNLLAACLKLYRDASFKHRLGFRLIHVSTDEVFGSATEQGHFDEETPYRPRSPYSASKAAADHLVAAWHHTYSLPAVITNCCNNYGPHQFPEKLIPHTIIRALTDQEIPLYGDGLNQRDWLFVDDHVQGLLRVAQRGTVGASYLFGARDVLTNLDLVSRICRILDAIAPAASQHADRITFVPDRPGHDRRYAIDPTWTEVRLGWRASTTLEDGLRKTVGWYVENQAWWRGLLDSCYSAGRMGLLT